MWVFRRENANKSFFQWSGLRKDIREAIDKGIVGEKLWDWCERETLEFR